MAAGRCFRQPHRAGCWRSDSRVEAVPAEPENQTANILLGAVGGLILWFGWYGFNPGSTLSIMDMGGAGRVAANTTLAACAAGLTACFWGYGKSGKWDVSYTVNGFLAGLVAITCPCYWVTPVGSLALGAVAGVLVILATDVLEYLRIDDPVGA